MKNKILLLIVIVLGIFAVSSFKRETTSLDIEQKEVVLAVKNSDTGLIENINLEEYVIGVVAGEMPASFNKEALKAQAIAARTYAIYKMNNSSKDYDLVTDITNQVYINKSVMKDNWQDNYSYYYEKIKEAVKETEDMVMTYDGDVILSMYFSATNGYTEDAYQFFGKSYDYLKSVESPEEVNKKSVSISKEDFCQKLLISCSDLKVNNIKRSNSGRVVQITINNKEYRGVDLRTKLGLRSTDFEIVLDNDLVLITTSGYGHGVGMSQYGANTLAKDGMKYDEILKFYYQNINIEKISV